MENYENVTQDWNTIYKVRYWIRPNRKTLKTVEGQGSGMTVEDLAHRLHAYIIKTLHSGAIFQAGA